MMTLGTDDPLAVSVVAAIQAGDLASLTRLLGAHPRLDHPSRADALTSRSSSMVRAHVG